LTVPRSLSTFAGSVLIFDRSLLTYARPHSNADMPRCPAKSSAKKNCPAKVQTDSQIISGLLRHFLRKRVPKTLSSTSLHLCICVLSAFCTALQHTATQCNTVQHIATWNTLPLYLWAWVTCIYTYVCVCCMHIHMYVYT